MTRFSVYVSRSVRVAVDAETEDEAAFAAMELADALPAAEWDVIEASTWNGQWVVELADG